MDAPVFPPDEQVAEPQAELSDGLLDNDAAAGHAAAPRPSFGLLGRLLSLVFHGFQQSEEEDQWRFNALTVAIERKPDAPSSYVMRGEMLLEKGEVALAIRDFETGLELADPRAESAAWGYIYRALADRAKEGLRVCHQLAGEDGDSDTNSDNLQG